MFLLPYKCYEQGIFSIRLSCLPPSNSVSRNTLTISRACGKEIKRAGRLNILASLCSLANWTISFVQHKALRTFWCLFYITFYSVVSGNLSWNLSGFQAHAARTSGNIFWESFQKPGRELFPEPFGQLGPVVLYYIVLYCTWLCLFCIGKVLALIFYWKPFLR